MCLPAMARRAALGIPDPITFEDPIERLCAHSRYTALPTSSRPSTPRTRLAPISFSRMRSIGGRPSRLGCGVFATPPASASGMRRPPDCRVNFVGLREVRGGLWDGTPVQGSASCARAVRGPRARRLGAPVPEDATSFTRPYSRVPLSKRLPHAGSFATVARWRAYWRSQLRLPDQAFDCRARSALLRSHRLPD